MNPASKSLGYGLIESMQPPSGIERQPAGDHYQELKQHRAFSLEPRRIVFMFVIGSSTLVLVSPPMRASLPVSLLVRPIR